MTPQEFVFWVIIGAAVAAEVLGGIVCWMCIREVDDCRR